MNIVCSPRQSGKTTQLINHSIKTGYTIVCLNRETCNLIKGKAHIMGKKIPTPISHYQFINGKYRGEKITGFLIDNADLLIKSLTPNFVDTIVMDSNDGNRLNG